MSNERFADELHPQKWSGEYKFSFHGMNFDV